MVIRHVAAPLCEIPAVPPLQLILELCREQPDEKVILPHLQRIRAPAALSSSSDYSKASHIILLNTSQHMSLFACSLR